ncbi:uncharacterized protein LOC133201190 [Saccostrea echinata]|uniref:uncharacterized protein LOC133201190 n=1 Tax=Saccostrea echinata TaxID=191078 RepID=UPI002A83B34A|nr:uncharacterized protein LOC133201190 [Saccostrea echinata]
MMMETKTPDTARSFTITYTPRVAKTGGILAQLCIRCGGYSASNHDYCIQCVESLKKTCCHNRHYDIKRKPEKKKEMKKDDKREHKNTFCIGCKMSDVGTAGTLCLICVAKRREKERQKNIHRYDYKDHYFGSGDLIKAYSAPPKDDSWKKDWRCRVCLQRVRPEKKPTCYGCEIKQMLLARRKNIVDVEKDLDKYKQEAIGVKDEFLSSEPKDGVTKWEMSYEVRKKSLEEIKNSVGRLNTSKKQDVDKQKEVMQYIDGLITACKIHFESRKEKSQEDPPATQTEDGQNHTEH